MKKEINNIIEHWLGNRKNTMDFSLLEKGIQNLLDKKLIKLKKEQIDFLGKLTKE